MTRLRIYGNVLAALALCACLTATTALAAPAKRTTASKSTPVKASPVAPAAPATAAPGRSLGDIHIEGEIAVPQVLFITARDQRRFMEFQHRRYLRTSLAVGEQTILPSRITVIGPPASIRKETPR